MYLCTYVCRYEYMFKVCPKHNIFFLICNFCSLNKILKLLRVRFEVFLVFRYASWNEKLENECFRYGLPTFKSDILIDNRNIGKKKKSFGKFVCKLYKSSLAFWYIIAPRVLIILSVYDNADNNNNIIWLLTSLHFYKNPILPTNSIFSY